MINPFIFLNSKIFPTYFHSIFSLVWKRWGAPDWLLFFYAFSTCERPPSPPSPADFLHGKSVSCINADCQKLGWDSTLCAGYSHWGISLWAELGHRFVRDEIWAATTAQVSWTNLTKAWAPSARGWPPSAHRDRQLLKVFSAIEEAFSRLEEKVLNTSLLLPPNGKEI